VRSRDWYQAHSKLCRQRMRDAYMARKAAGMCCHCGQSEQVQGGHGRCQACHENDLGRVGGARALAEVIFGSLAGPS
jgi:hypothetical protein